MSEDATPTPRVPLDQLVQRVRKQTKKSNYLLITLGYDNKLVLPYAQGMQLIQAMELAERLEDNYSQKGHLVPWNVNNLCVQVLSCEQYERIKMATLLNMSITEFDLTYPPTDEPPF